MTSGREFVSLFIEMYKDLPCLWKPTDPDYYNKAKRSSALDQLLEFFKEKDPDVTRDYLLKRIASLRGSYRKELNKVRASERSGVSPDEVHVPKLWYYDLMSFLEDQEVPPQSKRARSILDEMPFGDDEVGESGTRTPCSLSRESTPGPSGGSFRRPRSRVEKVLEKVASRIDEPLQSPIVQMRPKQQHDIFGEYIAEKLRSIPPGQLAICQKLINDAIFYAELGALTINSKIYNDDSLEHEASQSRARNPSLARPSTTL